MNIRMPVLLTAAVLILAWIVPGKALSQYYYPTPPQQPYIYDKQERERLKEERERQKDERKREEEWRKEERKRQKEIERSERRNEREYQQYHQGWYDVERWRWFSGRYLGGIILQPYPGEGRDAFFWRVRQQCRAVWDRCAAYCNGIYDPYGRSACRASCDNQLYECNNGF